MPVTFLKYSSFQRKLTDKPFELQIWFVITCIATLRTIKAVVQDVLVMDNTMGLVTDLFILTIFLTLSTIIYAGKISRIPVGVGIVLLLLLIFSYILYGGIQGSMEYNLMGLAFVFVLAYDRKELRWLIPLLFALTVWVDLDHQMDGWLKENFFKYTTHNRDTYFTTVITLAVAIFFFKHTLVNENKRMLALRKTLNVKNDTIERQHKDLKDQQQRLQEVNTRLEEEIESATRHIDTQDKALGDYVWLSSESLQLPLQRITANAKTLHEKGFLERQLKIEVRELEIVVINLRNELKRHAHNPS